MKRLHSFLLASVLIGFGFSSLFAARIDPELLRGMKARSIGPANMSGRIAVIGGANINPNLIYVGTAGGGLWKSEDRGITWNPVLDDHPVSSIGALAIDQTNPDIVWVGTGESKVRNSVGVGRGVFRTTDGGRSWKCMGLEKTEKIGAILIDPVHSGTIYVGALGPTWNDSKERGVFKSTDAGKTWGKILFVDERTGVADMAMDPVNPEKILVAMWEHRRFPWIFQSGGPGSGLHLTVDAGKTWKKLTEKEGLPKGDLGRIGLAFAPGRPGIAYALVEAKKSQLLRSTDGGFTWSLVNNQDNIDNRPFYYSRLWVNPRNENILYYLNTQFQVSEDGGKTFRSLASNNQAHSDHHALWVHPDGELMVAGNDGGMIISYNRGRNWRFVANLPVGQFYHVNFDMETPYNLYGGLQDNGTWRGPAYTLTETAIWSYLWKNVGWGDGFDAAPDPENPQAGYGMSQGGSLYYFDTVSGTSRSIVPTESEVKHRFHWNAAFAVDPFKPATIYLCSQFVHRSPDKGKTWEIISPDLTTNDPAKQKQFESGGLTLDVTSAENHCTITAIALSPLKEGVIWSGSDDGNIHLTRDGGAHWELVSKPIFAGKSPLAPALAWVTHIEASKHDAATAYAVIDDHRRGNWTPYLLVTKDFGKTWKNLATRDIDGFAYCLEEDAQNRNLLFAGTEFGLFFTLDAGSSWQKWTAGMPPVPVHDLAVHPRENDLVIATHGRAIYIIDDISPLRTLSTEVTGKSLHLFPISPARQFRSGRMSSYMAPGEAVFAGENKPLGACITYHLLPLPKKEGEPEAAPAVSDEMRQRQAAMGGGRSGRFPGMPGAGSSRVVLTILDREGKFVAQINGTEEKGLNRVYWNMRETEPGAMEAAATGMAFMRRGAMLPVPPGTYTVKIKYEKEEASQPLEISPDPRFAFDPQLFKTNYDRAKAAQSVNRAVTEAATRLADTRKAIQTVLETIRQNRSPKYQEIAKAARQLDEKAKALQEELNPIPAKQGIADRSASLTSQVMSGVSGLAGDIYEPGGQAALVKYEKAKAKADDFLKRFNAFLQTDIETFKKQLQESGFSLFAPYLPLGETQK